MGAELAVALAISVLIAGAAIIHRRAAISRRRTRLELLADCASLVDHPRIEADAAGFGVLKARRLGREVALRPFVDTLTTRRLPQLWLAVTVRTGAGDASTIEVMRRATGAEFYAAQNRPPRRFPTPAIWPADAEVRGSIGAAALLARLAGPLALHLADPRLKSVYVGPRGARVIRQAAEGSRGAYLLFRDARFAVTRIPAEEALAALAAAFAAADAGLAARRPDRRFDDVAA